MTSMLCGLVCVVLLSGLTALAGGQGESVYSYSYMCVILKVEMPACIVNQGVLWVTLTKRFQNFFCTT